MEPRKRKFGTFSLKPGETAYDAFMKKLVVWVALSCCCCGVAWGAIYYFVFGYGLTMLLPLAFVVIVGLAILAGMMLDNHKPIIYANIICILWISALIQWSIGSMSASGVVIAWSFLGPLGALIFLSVKEAVVWMVMFIAIVVISAVAEPMLLGAPLPVSKEANILFYIMNLCASTIVVFAASAWFVHSIKFERNRSEGLRKKIQNLFGQHVSTEVADKLITRGEDETESKAYDVTVMFLDIRDFTVFADSRAPKEVETFQNIVFSELINIVRENNGHVNQALGDGIMAIFGAPVETETHASDAVKAGFAMIKKTKELGDEGKITPIRVGIGLHSGKVIAGEVGNDFRKFYSIAGSNVIVAARIESLNKALKSQMLVSEDTWEQVQDNGYDATNQGEQKLKGMAKPVVIYQLA